MTDKEIRQLQNTFFKTCIQSVQPLEDIFDDLKIPYETFVSWMDEREFKSRMHGMRRFLKKARDFQLDLTSYRASGMLTRAANETLKEKTQTISRSACVDVIRLARDSRARRRSQEAEEIGRNRLLTHPDISDQEASRLTAELDANARSAETIE